MDKQLPEIKPEWLAGITMTQAQKDKWLSALRSGRYQQSRGVLYRSASNGYCCLGVYANAVHGIDNALLARKEDLGDVGLESILGDWRSPAYDSSDPETIKSIQAVLASMNDTGKSFAEIADFIDQHIPACDAVKP